MTGATAHGRSCTEKTGAQERRPNCHTISWLGRVTVEIGSPWSAARLSRPCLSSRCSPPLCCLSLLTQSAATHLHQTRFTTSKWLTLSFVNTFHVMFWINVATMFFVAFLVFKLHCSLRQAKAGSTRSDVFLLYPDYMAVLVMYCLVCLGTVLVLGVQGPYPHVPNWLYQAQYVHAC